MRSTGIRPNNPTRPGHYCRNGPQRSALMAVHLSSCGFFSLPFIHRRRVAATNNSVLFIICPCPDPTSNSMDPVEVTKRIRRHYVSEFLLPIYGLRCRRLNILHTDEKEISADQRQLLPLTAMLRPVFPVHGRSTVHRGPSATNLPVSSSVKTRTSLRGRMLAGGSGMPRSGRITIVP